MPNTYTQVYIQFVFAVQNRMSLINPEWENELYMYITGIVQNHKQKMIAINGIEDHVHIFVGMNNTTQSLASLMQIVKGESSEWINMRRFVKGKFSWQESYGAFSYGRNQVKQIYDYVMNQKEHHKHESFVDEYVRLLEEFDIRYDARYIFKPIE